MGAQAARLQTRLFNFRDDVLPEQADAMIAAFKDHVRAAGVASLLVGRNFIPTPFPTRFEWIFMVEAIDFDRLSQTAAFDRFRAAVAQLTGMCRNQVQCDLDCRLPPDFAQATGVGVRHTVMFSFKPGTPAAVRAGIVDDIRQMGTLPMVRHYLVEPSLPGVGGADELEWQVIGDFADVAAYKAYSAAPVHLAIRANFTANTARVAFLDMQP